MGFNHITLSFPSCNIKLTKQGRAVERVRLSRDLVNREPLRTRCLPSFGPVKPSSKGLRSTVAIPLRQSGGGRALSPTWGAWGTSLPAGPSWPAFGSLVTFFPPSLRSQPPPNKPPLGLLPIMPLHEARGDRKNSEGSEVKAWLWQHPREPVPTSLSLVLVSLSLS